MQKLPCPEDSYVSMFVTGRDLQRGIKMAPPFTSCPVNHQYLCKEMYIYKKWKTYLVL